MWRERIAAAGHRPAAPATEDAIEAAEAVVGCGLPDELRELLLESDGVRDQYGFELVFRAAAMIAAEPRHALTPGLPPSSTCPSIRC